MSRSSSSVSFIVLLISAASVRADPSDIVQYSIGALVIVQTLLIGVLLVQNRRRRSAKQRVDQLQAEVAHAARLAMAGEITASIAHEIAQPLSAILSNVETAELLLRRDVDNSAALAEILADIKRDDLRAHEIVRRLRALLQKRELRFENSDVNALVANAVAMLRTDAARRHISVRTDLGELPRVNLDRLHFQQVILNLLLNAMDAMANTPPATRWILVRTRCHQHANVEISVSDTGVGMTPEQLAHAFDSFFTTKEGGVGLGLSIARSIVQAHGGTITAQSAAHSGTTFRVTLSARTTRQSSALDATG